MDYINKYFWKKGFESFVFFKTRTHKNHTGISGKNHTLCQVTERKVARDIQWRGQRDVAFSHVHAISLCAHRLIICPAPLHVPHLAWKQKKSETCHAFKPRAETSLAKIPYSQPFPILSSYRRPVRFASTGRLWPGNDKTAYKSSRKFAEIPTTSPVTSHHCVPSGNAALKLLRKYSTSFWLSAHTTVPPTVTDFNDSVGVGFSTWNQYSPSILLLVPLRT